MKTVFTLALFLSFSLGAVAQETKGAAKQNTDTHVRRKIGPVTITGIVLASTGPVVSSIGLLTLIHESQKTYNPERPERHGGAVVIGTGLTMLAAGITMCIIGGIHDHREARRSSLSVIAPRNNEIGIAWDF